MELTDPCLLLLVFGSFGVVWVEDLFWASLLGLLFAGISHLSQVLLWRMWCCYDYDTSNCGCVLGGRLWCAAEFGHGKCPHAQVGQQQIQFDWVYVCYPYAVRLLCDAVYVNLYRKGWCWLWKA